MALPPLVDPAAELTPEREARYARTAQLPGFGMLAQRRLRAARVLVVGAGGLGSAVLPLLASAGFGTIGIVDDDRVEASNLPRQNLLDQVKGCERAHEAGMVLRDRGRASRLIQQLVRQWRQFRNGLGYDWAHRDLAHRQPTELGA